ncbi:MAG: aldo/keto reductase [Chloroflexi bacterium AL-W]|nr:aldo/keto reductase [Chloroflexi bacterium AL-N1]NOK69133.1 aldo/keto reductase [Chloroflexi bacterium AL-N10]NOK77116.1 aldo/keto reductase [Chloroflexi bacterium AL-N5]NOK83761.1 aldo/keto reductase [Chloroflexi bacterium AL-W]NOK90971.1 aldo/keto reductase [Chloroflexi bacterium AL-N15]
MEYRELGRTGYRVSVVSFGAWAIGSAWGPVDDQSSMAALHRALDLGINFFDTADVYGNGHSEQLLARLAQERSESFYVATKAGRGLNPHTAAGYNQGNLTAFVEQSLRNLHTEALDLLQLHCPPSAVYASDEVFGILDDLVADGKIRFYGVSVETVDEALQALQHANVQTVQIIFNMFRLKPAEQLFAAAKERQVGIIARVPLASGLLTGKMQRNTQFADNDHRKFNRFGEAFDRGETFSGVDYDTGLTAVAALREYTPANASMAQFALRWITMFPEVSCTIPGARNREQVEDNVAAADLASLDTSTMDAIQTIYNQYIRSQVHHLW